MVDRDEKPGYEDIVDVPDDQHIDKPYYGEARNRSTGSSSKGIKVAVAIILVVVVGLILFGIFG